MGDQKSDDEYDDLMAVFNKTPEKKALFGVADDELDANLAEQEAAAAAAEQQRRLAEAAEQQRIAEQLNRAPLVPTGFNTQGLRDYRDTRERFRRMPEPGSAEEILEENKKKIDAISKFPQVPISGISDDRPQLAFKARTFFQFNPPIIPLSNNKVVEYFNEHHPNALEGPYFNDANYIKNGSTWQFVMPKQDKNIFLPSAPTSKKGGRTKKKRVSRKNTRRTKARNVRRTKGKRKRTKGKR